MRQFFLVTVLALIGREAILSTVPSPYDDPRTPVRVALPPPELSELPKGESLVGKTFRVRVTVDGEEHEIPVQVVPAVSGVALRVAGRTFEFPDLNPLSGTRASSAIEDVSYERDGGEGREGIVLHSKSYGDVAVHDIRRVVRRLAGSPEGEEEVEIFVPYEPRSGPVLVMHEAVRALSGQKGGFVAPVTFRRCMDGDRWRQVARR